MVYNDDIRLLCSHLILDWLSIRTILNWSCNRLTLRIWLLLSINWLDWGHLLLVNWCHWLLHNWLPIHKRLSVTLFLIHAEFFLLIL